MKSSTFILTVVAFIGLAIESNAQKFFIQFTDKNNSSFSITNPSGFLTPRSIQRRVNQGIALTAEDLPVNQNYIDSVISKGAIVFTQSKWFNGVTVQCDSTVLAQIQALPFVYNSVKITRKRKDGKTIDKNSGVPVSLPSVLRTNSFNYGGSFNQINLMQGDYLHDIGFTGNGMVMAIIDAGFYHVDQLMTFDSLRNRNGILGTWDFVDNQASVYEDDTHGMEVLSTIAGNTPGQLVGTAPNANFWLLRSEDANTENIIEEYNWDAAAEFADSVGVDVISSSLGYTDFDDPAASHTYADMNGHTCPSSIAADIAVGKGMLVLTSAGNSGNNSWHYISAPSDGDSVLSVAAVDMNGNYVSFSSYGPSSDGDVKPNVAAKGAQSTIADAFDNIGVGSGTSFACPILAGSATCFWQAFPNLKVMEVKRAIELSANYFNTPTDTLGYGIPNFHLAYIAAGTHEMIAPEAEFVAYPNPFVGQLSIHLYSESNNFVIGNLYDFVGKEIVEFKSTLIPASFQNIAVEIPQAIGAGIYYLRVKVGEKTFSQKVVKQN